MSLFNFYIMKKILILTISVFMCSSLTTGRTPEDKEKVKIHQLLDNWHKAAADAKFEAYFQATTRGFVFMGTDATEHWDKAAFMNYAKPYFDNGKAWNFERIERHVYISEDRNSAWFDELLDTQMRICRGSGVILKQNGKWKIAQYVLSMTVPNEKTDTIVKIKAPIEDVLIQKIRTLK